MSKRNLDKGDNSNPKRVKSSRCNYCFRERELIDSKPYCTKCAEDAVECNVCHRPLPARLFEEGVCNACRKKQSLHCQRGLRGAASVVDINGDNVDDPLITMTNAKETAKEEIKTMLSEFNGIKWFISLIVTLFKFNREGEEIATIAAFRGETGTLLDENDIDEQYNN